ncbi:hypothetical protein A2239_04685 [Candidatus Uhrbacteria bacterium RIFOXYA2_FULL_40_9]|nr:MAG: hypothetical protein A2239_04685 [Candidatus Uhrbacteria bacterium RIFOXYA2_FULL_40_9]OGL97609.1 MAG: hypothetical protein A2332_03155 [Candidatus Uhrbacteria bacterium RIFOXYB2_FULL_41_18]
MSSLEQIEQDVQELKNRNKRVEAEKAWETSLFRILSISLITYLIAILVIKGIGMEKPFTGALIPTVGYFLSTQSLPILKRWWMNHHQKSS